MTSLLHHYPVQRLAGGVADPACATGSFFHYPLRTPHRNEGFRRIPRRDADAQKCHVCTAAAGRAGGFRRVYHHCKNRVTPSPFPNRPASSSRRSIAGEVSSSRLASTPFCVCSTRNIAAHASRTRRAYSLNRAFAIFGADDFVCGRRRLVIGKSLVTGGYKRTRPVSRRHPYSCNHAACNPRDVFKVSSFLAHSCRSNPCKQQSTEGVRDVRQEVEGLRNV